MLLLWVTFPQVQTIHHQQQSTPSKDHRTSNCEEAKRIVRGKRKKCHLSPHPTIERGWVRPAMLTALTESWGASPTSDSAQFAITSQTWALSDRWVFIPGTCLEWRNLFPPWNPSMCTDTLSQAAAGAHARESWNGRHCKLKVLETVRKAKIF